MATEAQTKALALVDSFRTGTTSLWPSLARSAVADGLVARINDSTLISSRKSSLCGPASVIYELAKSDPEAYAAAAIKLYDTGSTTIRSLAINASSTFKSSALPAGNDAVDWLMLGSLRDSDNWVFTYKQTGHWWDDAKAMTLPHAVADWMKKFGYTDIHNETNLVSTKGWDSVVEANKFYTRGYVVSLFVHSDMLTTDDQENFSVFPNHWIGMDSEITFSAILADPAAKISASVYSWGKLQSVPKSSAKPMHPKVFLRNYYGYVTGKP